MSHLISFSRYQAKCVIKFLFRQWLRRWIPNPGVPCSKPLGGSKVDSAFHPSRVDKTSTRNFWELNGKKVNCLLEVAVALRQLNPIHKKGAIKFKLKTVDDIINLKIFLGSTPKAMADREKQGKTKIEKLKYLKDGKSFLDEI